MINVYTPLPQIALLTLVTDATIQANIYGSEFVGTVYKKKLKNTNQTELRREKIIKKAINNM